jgi:predicted nucleotidyltransferase
MTDATVRDEKGVLEAVAQTASELALDVMVVGACARDLVLAQVPDFSISARRTFDVDIAVRVKNWEEFGRFFGKLQKDFGCRPDPRFKGRLLFPDGPFLDLVPFGAIADAQGHITWPPENDVEMGTAGFEAVLNAAVEVRIGEHTVKVATLSSIVLLKFLAWHDREDRTDDLCDIWFIFDNYLQLICQDRLYDADGSDADIIQGEGGFDWTEAGARVVGRDVMRDTGDMGKALLDWLDPEQPAFQDRFIAVLRSVVECSEQRAIDGLRNFRRGLNEAPRCHSD